MDIVGYIKNKVYAAVAFFLGFETFLTGAAEEEGSSLQYIMLFAALALFLIGIYFFRKKEKRS